MENTLKKNIPRFFKADTLLFLALILLEVIFFIYLILEKRLVDGHDGFWPVPLLYYFYNNIIASGEVPQWIPYLTHGTTSTWFQVISGATGIFHTALFLIAKIFKNVNFLNIFYAGIFFDRMLLLVGTWLLGTKFFKSPYTRFFVCASVMGSCVWMTQLYFNFYLYYALPFILYFLHEFLEKGKWRYFCAAGCLFITQIIGNVAYFIPILSLVIFLYCLLYCSFNSNDVKNFLSRIKFGKEFYFSLIYLMAALIAMGFFMLCAKDPRFMNLRTGGSSSIAIDSFLTYGTRNMYERWQELYAGFSPSIDYTLFIGFLSLPLLLMGFIHNFNRKNLHFSVLSIIIFCFSMGTIVSIFFYYTWPLMKYYRHLTLVIPIIKLCFCFIAGFSFEDIFIDYKKMWREKPITKYVMIILSFLLIALSHKISYFASHYDQGFYWIESISNSYVPSNAIMYDQKFVTVILNDSATKLMIIAVLFLMIIFLNWKKYQKYILISVLIFHAFDIYNYYFQELTFRTEKISNKERQSFNFISVDYPRRRSLNLKFETSRAEIINRGVLDGTLYWTLYPFVLEDHLHTSYRTEIWQKSLDNLMRAFWGQKINDTKTPLEGFKNSRLYFPTDHPASLKLTGVYEDKIQFFSKAFLINDEQELAYLINDSKYQGDILFLSKPAKNSLINFPIPSWSKKLPLDSNDRLKLEYDVNRFDANHLKITVHNTTMNPVWLYYSDVWHPGWKARINGQLAEVFQANLAYKAIYLPPGDSQVHFYFKSNIITLLTTFWGLNCWLWLGIVIYYIKKILFNKKYL